MLADLHQFVQQVQAIPSASVKSTTVPKIRAGRIDCIPDLDPNTGCEAVAAQLLQQQYHGGAPAFEPAATITNGHLLVGAAIAVAINPAAPPALRMVAGGLLAYILWDTYVSVNEIVGLNPPLRTPTAAALPAVVNQASLGTVGVPTGVRDAAALAATSTGLSSASIGPAPQGGLVLSDATTTNPPGSNAVVYITGSGASATALSLIAPESQANVPLSSKPNPFKGSLQGNWSGQCTDALGNVIALVGGTFSVVIDINGNITAPYSSYSSYDGSYSSYLAGHVDTIGNLSATGSASGGDSWWGHFSFIATMLSGDVSWSGRNPSDPSSLCSGGWSGTGKSLP